MGVVRGPTIGPQLSRLPVPRTDQCRCDRLRLERRVRHERGVTPAPAVGGLTLGFLEVSIEAVDVERVEEGAVMKERAPAASLRAARDFPPLDRQVAQSLDAEPRQLEGIHDSTQDQPVALRDAAQLGTRLE